MTERPPRGPAARLAALLAALTPERRAADGPAPSARPARPAGPAPSLPPRPPLQLLRATVVARRGGEADPITGHRGASAAVQVVAEAAGVVLEARLLREGRELVLRGQVVATARPAADLVGALVHVRRADPRAAGGAHLAPVDATGEFVVRSVAGASFESLDLELDEVVIRVPWPVATEGP